MRFLLAILFFLAGYGFAARAQDLTGQWTGSVTDNLSNEKQKLVLNIAAGDSTFGGVLHWWFPETQTIRHFVVRGQFHTRDSILSIMDDSLEDNRAKGPGNAVENHAEGAKGQVGLTNGLYILHYKRSGRKEVLEGHWKEAAGKNPEKNKGMAIRLEKKAPPFIPFVPLPHKKKDSAQQKQYNSLLARQSPVVATIPVRQQDSVRIELYDNGEIDGDSVSLYLNDELILSHLKLQALPKSLWIPIDKSLPVNKLILFAENLGKLPPNTALMEVMTKGNLYNVFLSTDYKHNAMVEFILTE